MLTVSTLLFYMQQTTLIFGIECGSNCESLYFLPGSDMLTANVQCIEILHFLILILQNNYFIILIISIRRQDISR
jgi:ABC-type methionine transport system permease subunit